MGCDIHAHVEVKLDGNWQNWSNLSIGRYYRVFGKLAKGVREDVPDAFTVKGLPKDLSEVTKAHYEYWKLDAHNMNYLTSSELVEFSEWLEENDYGWDWVRKNLGYIFGNHIWDIKKYPKSYEGTDLEDVRLVYWFDN